MTGMHCSLCVPERQDYESLRRSILRTETFLDAFNIIIFTTTGLCTFHEALKHNLFRGRVVDSQGRYAHLAERR